MSREFFVDFVDRNILFSNYIRGGVVTKLTDDGLGVNETTMETFWCMKSVVTFQTNCHQ